MLTTSLARVCNDLCNAALPFALIGGLALSVRTKPRFTRGLDFAIAVQDDRGAERLARYLHDVGYSTFATVEQRETGRLAMVRLWSPDASNRVAVDLLFASSGIELEVCSSAEHIEALPGITLPVARVGHLVALKLLSVAPDRPHDAQDLLNLRPEMDDVETDLARTAVRQVVARRANRGRDLVSDLEAWLLERG